MGCHCHPLRPETFLKHSINNLRTKVIFVSCYCSNDVMYVKIFNFLKAMDKSYFSRFQNWKEGECKSKEKEKSHPVFFVYNPTWGAVDSITEHQFVIVFHYISLIKHSVFGFLLKWKKSYYFGGERVDIKNWVTKSIHQDPL